MSVNAVEIKDLTADGRRRVEAILGELSRRKREERSRYFIPTSPEMVSHRGRVANDQVGFLMSPAPERWIFGGNRSGKTEMLVYDCNEFCCGRHPVRSVNRPIPVAVRMCAPPTTKDGSTGVVIEKLQSMVKRSDLLGGSWEAAFSPSERVLWYNDGRKSKSKGSYIQFKSNEQDVDKYGGWAGDAVYADEHYHIKYYRENKVRLLDRHGFYVHSMTPEAGAITWERKHVMSGNPDVAKFRFTMLGNPYLNLEAIEETERALPDDRIRRVKMEGEFASLSGLVYNNFYEQSSFIKFPKDYPLENWPRVCVLDPHLKKEHAILWAALSPEEELWVYRTSKINTSSIDELKAFIRAKSMGENIQGWIYDEAMGGEQTDNFGNQSIGRILTTGNNALPFVGTDQKSAKQFEAGVMKVREMFEVDNKTGRPRILIKNPECQELVDEINEYQFMPETASDELTFRQRVRSVFDDEVTCLRYAAIWAQNYSQGWGMEIVSALDGSWH